MYVSFFLRVISFSQHLIWSDSVDYVVHKSGSNSENSYTRKDSVLSQPERELHHFIFRFLFFNRRCFIRLSSAILMARVIYLAFKFWTLSKLHLCPFAYDNRLPREQSQSPSTAIKFHKIWWKLETNHETKSQFRQLSHGDNSPS